MALETSIASATRTFRAPEIDIIDPGVYERGGIPHQQFAWLRDNDPVHWHQDPNEGVPGFWAVTRHEDVVQVSRHADPYSSRERTAMFEEFTDDDIALYGQMMLFQDPPDHTRLRSMVNKGFTPRMIGRLQEHVREICHRLIDDAAPLGQCDFVEYFAAPLPLYTICELLGAPLEDRQKIFHWSNKLVAFNDPDYIGDRTESQMCAAEFAGWAGELARSRESTPRDDIVTKLLAPDADGSRITEEEFQLFVIMLSIAGNETTRTATAGGMQAFFERPGQWERLKADRSLLPTAVEEIVRWVSPINQFRRTALTDVELGGKEIRAGDKVVLFYGSANRDERVFDDPFAFDVGRDPNPHLGFGGGGPHFCLGTHLARMNLKIIFETILDRMPDIRAAGEPRRLRSNFVNGLKELPVRFTPSRTEEVPVTATPDTTPDIELVDPGAYEHGGIPHGQLAWLREHDPVHRHHGDPGRDFPPFWAVTRHEDVVHVSRHPELFSSWRRLALFEEPEEEHLVLQRMMMLNQDPPEHSRKRSIVNRGFTPRAIGALEEHIREICRELVAETVERGDEADFVRDLAAPLPLYVICELLGAPPEDREKIFHLSNTLIGGDDPEFQRTPEEGQAAATELYTYANVLAADRRENPREDIVTRLLQPDTDGEVLSGDEFELFVMLLSVAGNETTRNAASGGMLALLEHPEQWERLKADRSLVRTAADEIVRWVTPVNLFKRTAARDTEIRGRKIAEGDKVVVFYGSANRDEAVFADPYAFDVGRDPNPHLGFGGGGPHFCLGAHLARLELSVLFETLLDAMPNIELNGNVRRLRSSFINGIKEMPVRVRPASLD